MSVYTLTRVCVEPEHARRALQRVARLGHRLERLPGFLGLQFFHTPDAPGTILALTAWESLSRQDLLLRDAEVARRLAALEECCTVEPPRRLTPVFHLHFPRKTSAVGLARLTYAREKDIEAARAVDKEAGLKSMALPGTVGAFGAHCTLDPRLTFCRLEFDTQETLRRYLASEVSAQWQETTVSLLEEAGWWPQTERLEYWRVGRPDRLESEPRAERIGHLNLEIETDPREHAAVLRFHGRLDAEATTRFVKVRDALIRSGCLKLTLDLSDLGTIAPAGLEELLETARQLKAADGHLTLIDNEGRFNRIVRGLRAEREQPLRRAREDAA